EPSTLASTTGRQSAVMMANTLPAVVVIAASATGADIESGSCGTRTSSSASSTCTPCTCCSHTGAEGNKASSRFLFAATSTPSSSVCKPRFMEDQGPVLTPPWRVVQKYSTP